VTWPHDPFDVVATRVQSRALVEIARPEILPRLGDDDTVQQHQREEVGHSHKPVRNVGEAPDGRQCTIMTN
jgi:hypothetical protein